MTPNQLLIYLYELNILKDEYWNKPFFFTNNLLNGCSKEELDVIRHHLGDKIERAKSNHQRTNLSKVHSTLD